MSVTVSTVEVVEVFDDDGDWSDFECPECGKELDEEDVCRNEGCPAFGEEAFIAESDWQARQHERRQMGIGL